MKKTILIGCLIGTGLLGVNRKDIPRALFLLDTKDPKAFKATVKFIETNRGDAGISDIGASVIFGRLPKEIAPSLIGKSHIVAIYFDYIDPSSVSHYGEETVMAVKSFNNMLEGEGTLPVPSSLSTKIKNPFIEFSWNTPLPKARIEISKGLSFNNCVLDTIISGRSYKFASVYLDEGRYYWRLYVLNDDEKARSNWTESFWFEVGTFTLQTLLFLPTLVMPTDTASILGPYDPKFGYTRTFVWNAVNGALGYRIQVSHNNEFKNTISDSVIEGTTTGHHRGGNYEVEKKYYYWRVSAFNDKGYSHWSEIWRFYRKSPGRIIPPGYDRGKPPWKGRCF